MTELSRAELATYIDHTLLKPEATAAAVQALAAEARELGAYSICISPSLLAPAALGGRLDLDPVKLAVVCGFPSGCHLPEIKAAEAAAAVEAGADEIDMVINIGMLKAGDADYVESEIRTVREAAPGAILKVIIEAAALTETEIVTACRAAEAAMADFVKTSTGFHPAGGASVAAVRLMRETVGDRLGVKASGGIRDYAAAMAMIDAGATRLGLSGTAAVLDGAPGERRPSLNHREQTGA